MTNFIGDGFWGRVFEVYDHYFDKHLAIKIIIPASKAAKKAEKEVSKLKYLNE